MRSRLYRATFQDGDQVRAAGDEATAHRLVRRLYGPGNFTLEVEKPEDAREFLALRRPRSERGPL
jgi:hypothetical protein